ncbi:MAG: Pycsar system effector family protein [Pseudomonadota bacterium]
MTESKNPTSRNSVDHFLRTAQTQHMELSAMADRKASMVLGTCMILFTLIVGQIQVVDEKLPLFIMAVTAVVSAVFAILAVMPNFKNRSGESQNLLFFGTFAKMSEQEYIDTMFATMESNRDVYQTQIRDIYQIGQVLYQKKYRFLRYSYICFLLGLLATSAAGAALIVS